MMTPRQKRVYDFIKWYQMETGGVCPSYREIAAGVELKSIGHVSKVLQALSERGYIRVLKNRARSIEILK